MTDKATVELPSPVAGTVVALNGEPGEKRRGRLGAGRARSDGAGNAASAAGHLAAAERAASRPDRLPRKRGAERAAPLPPARSRESAGWAVQEKRRARATGDCSARGCTRRPGDKPLASPAVRRRAWDLGIALQFVPGTGPGGRITQQDLDAYASLPPRPPPDRPVARREAVEEVPIIGVRRAIAEHLEESKRHIPHFSYVEEVDVTALEELRGPNSTPTNPRARRT